MTALRPYQEKAVTDLRRSLSTGHRAPLLVAPCGSGKTVILAAIIQSAAAKSRRTLFLAPRRELVYQTREKLIHAGVPHGIVMAGEDQTDHALVQVACTPTIMRRAKTRGLPHFDLVIQDESHIGVGGESGDFLKAFQCPRIGFTATPCRSDGRGLGELYDDLVLGPNVAELTAMGFLVPVRYFAPSNPDLAGVKVTAGDYNQKQLGAAMDKVTLIGDVLENWKRIAPTQQTIVSAVTVAHSLHLRDAFREAGIKAEQLDGDTPNDERARLLRDFREGKFQVLANCEVLSYGYDEPSATCLVLAKPTKSISRYLQIAGRVLRPHPGKEYATLIDHSGAVEKIGFVDDVFPWTLDGTQKVQELKLVKDKGELKMVMCPACKHVYKPAPACPMCGHASVRKAKPVATTDAELVELSREGKKANQTWTPDMKRRFYGELLTYKALKGKSSSWMQAMWKQKFGVWIRGMDGVQPAEVSLETQSWIRSRGIAWSKSKARTETANIKHEAHERGPEHAPLHGGDAQ